MKKQRLFNKVNRELLKKALINEPFKRITASFYKYFEVLKVVQAYFYF